MAIARTAIPHRVIANTVVAMQRTGKTLMQVATVEMAGQAIGVVKRLNCRHIR